ncbi:Hipothetical protein [Propionibacterium freudenreichii]|nr:Hipothetical protein [Propionibacterium freudenreichii]
MPVSIGLSKSCAATEPGTLLATASQGQLRVSGASTQTLDSPLSQQVGAGSERISPADTRPAASGGVYGVSGAASWFSPCAESRTDQVVQVPGGEATLLVSNPDNFEAVVSITLTGPQGALAADDLRDVRVPAHTTATLDLSARIRGLPQVGARIRATQGRVAAVARSGSAGALDYQDSTGLARTSTVAAVPSGASKVTLLLTNPDTVRTSAKISAVGESGSFDPGNGTILIEAERTVAVDVSGSVSAESAALTVTARSNIAVSAVVTLGTDVGLLAGRTDSSITSGDSAGLALPGPARLIVSNLADGPREVTVNWGAGQAPLRRTIAAQATLALFTPQDARTAEISTGGPFVAGAAVTQTGLTLIPAQPIRATQGELAARPAVDLGR